jgi:hypothetical protein
MPRRKKQPPFDARAHEALLAFLRDYLSQPDASPVRVLVLVEDSLHGVMFQVFGGETCPRDLFGHAAMLQQVAASAMASDGKPS